MNLVYVCAHIPLDWGDIPLMTNRSVLLQTLAHIGDNEVWRAQAPLLQFWPFLLQNVLLNNLLKVTLKKPLQVNNTRAAIVTPDFDSGMNISLKILQFPDFCVL